MQNSRPNILPITKLKSFIREYPNEKLHSQFEMLSQSFPYHRIIKGDGNCFYRAYAFLYLASSPCQNFNRLFAKIDWVCKNSPNQLFERQPKIFQKQLYETWSKYIKQISDVQTKQDKQKMLERLFNHVENFDTLMVGYFRSLNYHNLKEQKRKFLPFVENESKFESQLQRTATFGKQSQGIQIGSLAQATNTKLTVFIVDENFFQPHYENQAGEDKGFFMFYRPGHYDIIYQSSKQKENNRSSLKQKRASIKQQRQINTPEGQIIISPEPAKNPKSLKIINEHKDRISQRMTTSQSLISKQPEPVSSPDRSASKGKLARTTTNFYTTRMVPQFSKYDVKYRDNSSLKNFKQNLVESSSKKQDTDKSNLKQKQAEKSKIKNKKVVFGSGLSMNQKLLTQLLGVLGLSALAIVIYSYF